MGKMSLKEELERIHSLTYGKKVVLEYAFMDKILNFTNNEKGELPNYNNDPKKANYVTDNVRDFFTTLQNIDEPLFQEEHGTMKYQKDIETVQIGLVLLGYQLPQYGVDGLFGPETAATVKKFKTDNNITETINESTLNAPIPITKITQQFGVSNSHESSHPGVDLRAMSGTEVKSPGDGTISNVGFTNGGCGGSVTIDHGNGLKSRFCHLKDFKVGNGQQVKQGETIGVSGGDMGDRGAGNSRNAHLHFELQKDGHLVDPMDYVGSNGIDITKSNTGQSQKEVITPDMIQIMVKKLQEQNVKPQDLDKLIDRVTTGGGITFTDIDLTTDIGFKTYSDICQKYIITRITSSPIHGEMLAYGARQSYEKYHKYVPPELALSQLTIEGGLSNNLNAKPIRTMNPFNVGNTESGTKEFATFQEGINAYYDLIAGNYIGRGKTASDLLNNFVNKQNERYATEQNYESELSRIASQVNKISTQVTAQS